MLEMPDKLSRMRMPANTDPHMPDFLRRLQDFSPIQSKDDAILYLLMNPRKSEIKKAAVKAMRDTAHAGSPFAEFKGFRAVKLYNSESGISLCFLWPSFCWTHHHVRDSAAQLPNFTVVEGDIRFNFDTSNGFSDDMLNTIDAWMKTVRKEPLPIRSVREE